MKLKLAILLLSILALGMIATAEAQTSATIHQCVDNETLMKISNETRCIDNKCTINLVENYEYCNFGCDSVTQSCSPDTFTVNMYLIGGFILFIIIMAILFKKLGGR